MITQQIIQQGLRKCPMHKHGAILYKNVGSGHLQCEKCKGFIKSLNPKSDNDFMVKTYIKNGARVINQNEILPAGKYQVKCMKCGYGHPKEKYMDFEHKITEDWILCPACTEKGLYIFI